jgi:hypothetical protein
MIFESCLSFLELVEHTLHAFALDTACHARFSNCIYAVLNSVYSIASFV